MSFVYCGFAFALIGCYVSLVLVAGLMRVGLCFVYNSVACFFCILHVCVCCWFVVAWMLICLFDCGLVCCCVLIGRPGLEVANVCCFVLLFCV